MNFTTRQTVRYLHAGAALHNFCCDAHDKFISFHGETDYVQAAANLVKSLMSRTPVDSQ